MGLLPTIRRWCCAILARRRYIAWMWNGLRKELRRADAGRGRAAALGGSPGRAGSERVAKFDGIRLAAYWWYGLAPDDSPMVLRDIGTQEIYRLDVEWP